jgi:hypothetical protein
MNSTCYTIGYHALKVADLVRWAEGWDVMVLDTRIVPFSRNPDWGRPSLIRRLRGRYLSMADTFGNRRYKETDPDAIDLVDALRGVYLAARLLRSGSICIFCLCEKWDQCHRREVASLIHEATGAPIHHLNADDLSPQGRLAL